MHPENQPIAVVGMACRFPKIDGVNELWKALVDGFNAVDVVPADRWDPDRYYSKDEVSKGKAYVRRGGFVNQDPKTFDANFFGISPREAENMDPQQRLLLEVVWEAFENSGLILPEYAGKNVGVYVGGFMLDHMITQMAFSNRCRINQHTAAGMMMTMLSNRVSHTFDLRGPSLSMDTACSSSLVAFHYACQDVWRGACEMAVVGGSNVMMRPEYPMGMCKGHFLSRDGESKSFDSRGDGYGRGEGAGVVLIKPLDAAVRDGDNILATVIGTGTNQDGRTPGISMPNGEAQQALIEEVCEQYRVTPSTVDYVECHGTGTAIGDPTECGAIGATYGKDRADNPVVIGSIKSNIGHLEAAAGVAGVIKAVLTIMHRKATPLGNLQETNEAIKFDEIGVRLSDKAIEFDKPMTVAVNSFGYGGSNAHALLTSPELQLDKLDQTQPHANGKSNGQANGKSENEKQAESTDELFKAREDAIVAKASTEFPYVLPITARSNESLNQNAHRLADWLRNGDASLSDVIYSAVHRRAHLNFRAVAMGRNKAELIQAVESISNETEHENVVRDAQPFQGLQKPVFVFTGMGPQWWYMGQHLYRNEPVYQKVVDEADALFREIAGFSILEQMLKSEEDSEVQKTIYAQPANFIIQLGVLKLLEEAGVRPGLCVGHSVGELGSAYAAGVLSLKDALTVSYYRSQIQAKAAGQGGMMAVGLSKEEAVKRIEPFADQVSLAAINSTSTVTLAGDVEALKKIGEELTLEKIFNKELEVEIPYHSPLMDPLKPELEAALSHVKTNAPNVPLYSTVTGEMVTEPSFGAKYWPENIREPVEFELAIRGILEEGYNTFVEIGPHPVLSSSLRDCIKASGKDCRLIHTLRRNLPDETACVQRAAMSVFAAGCEIDWTPHVDSHQFVQLPNYAWKREHYWTETDRAAQERIDPLVYPILGTQEARAAPVWRNDFDHEPVNYLRDHVVAGTPILPAAAYLEALLELASIQFPDVEGYAIRNVEIMRPAVITAARGIDFTTAYDPQRQRVIQRSLESDKLGVGGEHLTANIAGISQVAAEGVSIKELLADAEEVSDPDSFYMDLAQLGLNYGPAFQAVRSLHQRAPGEMIARIEIDEALAHDVHKYNLHPSILDGCFQSLMAMLDSQDTTYLPTHIGELNFYAVNTEKLEQIWCVGRMIEKTDRTLKCDLQLLDNEGNVVVTIRGLKATAAQKSDRRVDKFGDPVKRQVLRYHWDYGETPAEPKRLGHWLAVGNAGETSEFVNARLESFGAKIVAHVGYEDRDAVNQTIAFDSVTDAQAVLASSGQLDGIVFYLGMDEDLVDDCPTGEKALNALITFTQAMLEIPIADRPRVYVVTQSAFDIDEFEVEFQPLSASLNGWVRVAASELAGFQFTTIDIDDSGEEEVFEAVALELACDMPHDEVAIRGDFRLVSELRETGLLTDDVVEPQGLTDSAPVLVRPLLDGQESVGTARVVATDPMTPGDDEIVLAVEKSLLPLNLLQDQSSDQITSPCVEIVGKIIAKGQNVDDVEVGARVCGLAPAELASHISGPRDHFFLTAMPEDADGAQLVAGVGSIAAAKRAIQIHEFEPGDRALVQLSPMGITVATELKHAGVAVTLLTQDPENVPTNLREDYRLCVACPESIQSLVSAAGPFDLLAGEIGAWVHDFGFGCLRAGGGIIDTSERSGSLHALPPSVNSVSRTDMSSLRHNRKRLESAVAEAVADIASGERQPPQSPFEIALVDIAWKKLPLGEMDSRLVISYETDGRELPVVQPDSLEFKSDATYLITGGFGGFGRKTALWLARHGAQHLVLTGRSGANNDDKRTFVEELESLGVTVNAAACDTGDIEQLAGLFQEIAETMPPLKGVFHSGAVIIDQAINETDLDTFNTVMRAKATGAWNLHLLTQEMELDHFVMYSSLSNQIGNSRQGAYCASNGYLNGLARLRKSLGLPGLSVNWGAISDVGVIAQDEKLEQFMKHIGLRGLPSAEGLELQRIALGRNVNQFGVVVIKSWADWARYETLGSQSPRFAAVIAADSEGKDSGMRDQLIQELAPLAPADKVDLMAQLIAQIVSSVLKADAETIALDRPINELGIDSLMATEIQVLFESKLGIAISVLELIGDTTIRSLSASTVESLQSDMASSGDVGSNVTVEDVSESTDETEKEEAGKVGS